MEEHINQNQIKQLEQEVALERERLSSDRMDISFGELINLYKNNELIIRPAYQRLYRWTPSQKTALIESILLGIPIPPIFVAEDQEGVWELVDGLQRVSTFISFFGELDTDVTQLPILSSNKDEDDEDEDYEQRVEIKLRNRWILEAGGLLKSLEGLTIETLPSKYKINLKRAVCRVEILRGESNIAMKYELFKRLNSGGAKLTPQEIRNAIYRGINPALNDLTLELSQWEVFKKLTELSSQKKQELYDQELILRFIAFFNNVENVNDNTENFLNKFMEKAVTDKNFNIDQFRKIFREVLELINQLEDTKVFRNEKNYFVTANFEGITIGLAQNIEFYQNDLALLRSKIEVLKKDAAFTQASGSSSNSKQRIRKRLLRANEIFSSK